MGRNGCESSSDESIYGFCSKRRRPVSALVHQQRGRRRERWEGEEEAEMGRGGWSEGETVGRRGRRGEVDHEGRRGGWSEEEGRRGREWLDGGGENEMMGRREGWSEDETMAGRRGRTGESWWPRQRRDGLLFEGYFQREGDGEGESRGDGRRGWGADMVRGEEEERRLRKLDEEEEEQGSSKDCWGQRNVSKANANLAKLHQSFGSRKEGRCKKITF